MIVSFSKFMELLEENEMKEGDILKCKDIEYTLNYNKIKHLWFLEKDGYNFNMFKTLFGNYIEVIRENNCSYKIGDRVRVISNINPFPKAYGEIATIYKIEIMRSKYELTLNFDNNVNGWENIVFGIEEGHGLFVLEEDVELIQ